MTVHNIFLAISRATRCNLEFIAFGSGYVPLIVNRTWYLCITGANDVLGSHGISEPIEKIAENL